MMIDIRSSGINAEYGGFSVCSRRGSTLLLISIIMKCFTKNLYSQHVSSLASLKLPLPVSRSLHTPNINLKEPRVLITGGEGQIGTELKTLLRAKYGRFNVIASDIKKPKRDDKAQDLADVSGPFIYLDVLDSSSLARTVVEYDITHIVHNSSILSAAGERNPHMALEININGLQNCLEVARKYDLRIFVPSSIAAFGPSTPKDNTPDSTIMRPTTIYGITKVYTELLGEYYHSKYGTDFRSLRYPGIISSETLPGGGTTDYAVEIFYEALKHGRYNCFLKPDSELPMMMMSDCLKATQMLLEADNTHLTQRTYNVSAVSFTPSQLAESITKYLPDFKMTYSPDFRQKIADSWPRSLDDSQAKKDWNWSPEYDLDKITKEMLIKLKAKLSSTGPTQPLSGL
eukprot:TRINITY_DN11689_c0_g1_i1.p1 TRINITY_DN11689_c0_g1~~TRINITY_DN11689_c0_g1_i1.p1  ORF type:complete len:401 (+),score=102.12 TRINITY_DN11689_c0_g1_i1:1123-2325(+)